MSKKSILWKDIWLIVVFIMAMLIFYWIADEAVHEHEDAFDQRILHLRNSFVTPALIRIMRVVTVLGSQEFLIGAYTLLALFFIIKRKYWFTIMIICNALGAFLVNSFLKNSFQRDRPEFAEIRRPTNYSFPSGHSFSSFVFGSVLVYLVWRTSLSVAMKWTITIFLLVMVICIGFSRVVLNVHYATDVIGGFALGLMWAIMGYAIARRLFVQAKKDNQLPNSA